MPSATNNRRYVAGRYVTRAASLVVIGFFSIGHALAAGPSAAGASQNPPPVPDQALTPADQALSKDVSVLENRFFFHQYRHDPMEKRLERLELLTLGAAQGGSNPERLTRLKQSVMERDREAAKTIAREQKGDGELAAKTNYPVLGTLEWRMLKKTFPSESIDQRLARMESQLFGMPAQAMSYIDRIDRLKKTVGMDIATAPPATPRIVGKNQIGLNGPLPRANHPGQQLFSSPTGPGAPANGSNRGYLYDDKGNVTGWFQNNSQSWSFPGNSSAQPAPNGQQNVFEAMDQMNRQMNEMMRHLNSPSSGGLGGGFGGGFGGFGGGGFEDTPFSVQIGPDGLNRLPGQQAAPRINQGKVAPKELPVTPQPKKFTQPKDDLPAYTDPNSI